MVAASLSRLLIVHVSNSDNESKSSELQYGCREREQEDGTPRRTMPGRWHHGELREKSTTWSACARRPGYSAVREDYGGDKDGLRCCMVI